MLIKRSVLDQIAAGTVTLAFRRWKRATVKAGGTLTTAVGVLSVEAVDVVAQKDITEREAKRAGFASRAELMTQLKRREGRVYRIKLKLSGPDPRIALRKRKLSAEEAAAICARIPWARQYLELIRDQPAVLAADLAAQVGVEKKAFKQRVRKLKSLGLTESLKTGYRLSARGRSLISHS